MKKKEFLHFCIDTLLVTGSFLFILWIMPATRRFYIPAYDLPFAGFMGLWIVSSLLFGKYKAIAERGIVRILDIVFRSNILVTAIIASLIFLFDRFTYSRQVVFGTLILATVTEIVYGYLVYLRRRQKKETDSTTGIKAISTAIDYTFKEKLEIPKREEIPAAQQVTALLRERYLKNIPGLFDWVKESLPLTQIKKDNAVVLYSHHIYNIEFYDPDTLELFINLYEVNDLRHVNAYFSTVWKDLVSGGYYLLCARTNDVLKQSINDKYPAGISHILYLWHFCFHRVMPKIPGLAQLYFSITKGKKRAFSFTEVLGRLYYCGFSSVANKVIDDKQYFLVAKTGHPVQGQQPTYGPLIRLNRVGKDGKPIKVLKMRTMHPYSEFLQDYVYQMNDLKSGGKFKDDFRITTSGKIMRRLWLDELPMLLNLIRGDIKLVGIRPISKHYMNLYSKDLQEMRKHVKPGLIPPYYADLPKTLEEIEASEIRYIEAYRKNHWGTDIKYLFKAFGNIFIRKARSA